LFEELIIEAGGRMPNEVEAQAGVGCFRIMGIDPGLRRLGYSIIEKSISGVAVLCAGVLKTEPTESDGRRLDAVASTVRDLVEEFAPMQVAVERVLFSRNVSSALRVAEAVGVIKLTCFRFSLPVIEVGANQVKQAFVGDGAASKAQMQAMAAKLLGLNRPPSPPDVADALAVAYTQLLNNRWVLA
jgi:crossover junction endodeoxyribonuclease RuvC